MIRSTAVVAIVLVVASVAAVGFAGPAAAGDGATILEVDPEDAEAPPGEEVHVAIEMFNDGGYGGEGVERVAFGVEYDSDVLTLDAVTRGPWMEQGSETDVVTEVDADADAGYAFVEQYRDPADGGATGSDRLATLTFTVDEDANGETSPIELTDVESELTTDWPQYTFTHDGTVTVDENADVVGASAPERSPDYEAGADDDDSLPGFGVAVGIAALVAIAAAAAVRNSSDE